MSGSARSQREASSSPGTLDRQGGTLQIHTDPSCWPAAGLKFRVLANGERQGEFAVVGGATRAGESVSYTVAYTSAGAKLTTR